MKEQTVGVLGCGTMGSGIAQVAAQAGCTVIVLEVAGPALEAGLDRIDRFLGNGVQRGKLGEEDLAAIRGRITGTTSWGDLDPCDVIVEAVTEDIGAKRDAMQALSGVLRPEALVATNTSCLSVTEIAAAYVHPEQVVGLHFFNPAQLMKLVEVVRAVETSAAAFDRAFAFAAALGKEPIKTKDSPGFIVNRLLIPYLLDAVRAYENKVGSIEEIDEGMKLGAGHPMGPFTLLDFVGLDTTNAIADIMWDKYRETRFAAPPTLRRLVAAGYYGRKTGRGFYNYSEDQPVPCDPLAL